mgnify:CR=1 FL=1
MKAALLGAALLAGCAHDLVGRDHPLAGRVWDVRAAAFVSADEVYRRAVTARPVILGEVHDNPEHHRLQRSALEALAQHGGPRALAMEQFDAEHQEAIDAARAKGADIETLADAGRFDRAGWDWPAYRRLVEFALERGWPLIAANLSRAQAGTILADPSRSGLPAAGAALREALERDLIEGHCGKRPDAKQLAAMVEAQRARDARMARALQERPDRGSVLIAGNGHARRDRGMPLYLAGSDIVSIGYMEVECGKIAPRDYLSDFATPQSFDYLWFTPRAARQDPCARPGRSGAAGKAL